MKFKEIERVFLRSKVARRIFFLFIICALLPLSTLAYFSFKHVTRQLHDQANQRLHQVSKAAGMTIIEHLLFLESNLKMIIANFQTGTSNGIESAIHKFSEQFSDHFKGFVLVRSDQIIASQGTIQISPQLSHDERKHINAGKTLLLSRPNQGKFASVYMARALDSTQPSQGILFGKIHPGYLWGGADSLPSMTEIFVLDQTNNVLFSSFPESVPLQELEDARQDGSANMQFTWTHYGETYLASYWIIFMRSQFFAKWILVHSQSEANILEPLDDFKNIFELVVILTFLVMLVLSLSQIRKSLVPIDLLQEATWRITEKDLKSRVEIKSNDEFEELGIAFNKMVDSLEENQNQLEYQAFYDQLTNLPNRSLFTKHLERTVAKRLKRQKDYQFAVLFMDLDRFKIVNDSMGHIIGDQLLIGVAKRLKAGARFTDVVSRFGGDEFAILIDDISDISDTTLVAERVKDELALPFNLGGHEVFTTASIGIALSVTEYENAEDVLRDADSAMYRAKSLGRARYEIFDTEMHASATRLLQLESDLRRAIEHNEFMAHYQPIVSQTDGRIISAEALIRWQHPERGLVPPMEFIPLAEDTGLILQIGEWILRTACAQNKAWQDAGYQHLRIGINFSSYQFKHQNIPDLIKKILNETGMPAQSLNVEITESIAMEEKSVEALNKLSAMGVQTSIDDFGTGYSSLGSLKRFPINTVKIDRVFIKGITKDPNIESIIIAIIAMAHSLNMKVVAEGVETKEQWEFLNSHECDEIQGYFCSPPVPADKFEELLKKGWCFEITDKKKVNRAT